MLSVGLVGELNFKVDMLPCKTLLLNLLGLGDYLRCLAWYLAIQQAHDTCCLT